jgi:hypothetical protein
LRITDRIPQDSLKKCRIATTVLGFIYSVLKIDRATGNVIIVYGRTTMKKINLVFIFLFVIFTPNFAVAKIFEDTFDDQLFTTENWIQAVPHWDFITLDEMIDPIDTGFRGLYISEDTFAIADSGKLFAIENLYMSIGIKTLYKEIIEPHSTTPKDQGGGFALFNTDSDIGISAELYYSGNSWIHSAGMAGEGGSVTKKLTNIEFNVFYYLELFIDDNRVISSRVLSESGEIISTIEDVAAPDLDFGIVGIGSQSDAVFNNFILNAQLYKPPTYYRDNDNDGYGDPNTSLEEENQPSGYVTNNTDCDDNDNSIYPGATEIREDGIDQDCNGSDLPSLNTYFRDYDEDGYGDPDGSIEAASLPSGFVTDDTDCNDYDSRFRFWYCWDWFSKRCRFQ